MLSGSVDTLGLFLNGDWHAGELQTGNRAVGAEQVDKADLIECMSNSDIDSFPGVANAAHMLDTTMAICGTALGYRDRAFKGIDDICSTDQAWVARKAVTAIRTASGGHEVGMGQRLEQLADGRQGNAGCGRDIRRTANGAVIARQVGE